MSQTITYLSLEEVSNMDPLKVRYLRMEHSTWDLVKEMKNLEGIQINMGAMNYELPQWFSTLTKLRIIDLFNMEESTLENSIGCLAQLPSLVHLSLDIGPVTSKIGLLKQIKRLDIWTWDYFNPDITIEFIEALAELPNLEELRLEDGEFPPEIETLSNLKRLTLGCQENPETIQAIFHLSNLEWLSLRGTILEELSESEITLPSLNYLCLQDCKLEKVPVFLYNIPTLENLSLAKNYISELPVEMENLGQLKTLDLKQNQLIQFPMVITRLKELLELDLSKNYKMGNPPLELFDLNKLKNLRLNQINMDVWPDRLENLAEISELVLSNNFIGNPSGHLRNLKNLKRLELDNCGIEGFPEEVTGLTGLNYLSFNYNSLGEIPKEIKQLSALVQLNIEECGLKKLPSELSELKQLKILSIEGNPFTGKAKKELATILPTDGKKTEHQSEVEQKMIDQLVKIAVANDNEVKDQDGTKYLFVVYDCNSETGTRELVEAITLRELLLETGRFFVNEVTQYGEYVDKDPGIELPEEGKSMEHFEILYLLQYLQEGFDYYTAQDDYERDIYIDEIMMNYPEHEFLFGWGAAPPRQEEGYAILKCR